MRSGGKNRPEFTFRGLPRTVIELESDYQIENGKEIARSLERLNSVITFYPNGVKKDWVLFDLHDGSLFSVVRYSADGTVAQVIDEPPQQSGTISPANAEGMTADLHIELPAPEETLEYDEVGNWIKSTTTIKMAGSATVFVTRRVIHYY